MIPIEIKVSAEVPPDTIWFISPRKFHYVRDPQGRTFKIFEESEKYWMKRCALITRVKT